MTQKKPFERDEMVDYDGGPVRIESGPWSTAVGTSYLIETASGCHALIPNHKLTRQPPKPGDAGTINDSTGQVHPYSPHTWVYKDDDVILLKDRLGDYDYFIGYERQRIIDTWETI